MNELDIIHELTKGSNLAPKINGVGDDCALLQGNGIVTTDTMVEDVHFDDRLSPSDVGWKLVAVNASDIAAMGRYPSWATLNLTLPKAKNKDWLIEFSKGMRSALSEWDISLVGGDVVRGHKHVVASMTMGAFGRKKLVWQHEAAVKNTVWVTGYLGEAAAGFFDKNEEGLKWLRRPSPPIEFGHNLGNIGIATSMIDISDGLHKDLTRICMRSDVGAVIYPDLLPKGPALAHLDDVLAYQTAFGEDYQLLFTTLPNMDTIVRQIARRYRVRVTEIGKIVSKESKGGRIQLKGQPWPKPLFEHF